MLIVIYYDSCEIYDLIATYPIIYSIIISPLSSFQSREAKRSVCTANGAFDSFRLSEVDC